jgi:CRISPR-associated protein Csm1
MPDNILNAALAGLLHDVGKFAQRAGVMPGAHAEIGAELVEQWRTWLPSTHADLSSAIRQHGAANPTGRLARIVRLADRLAGGDREPASGPSADPATIALAPVLGRVTLGSETIGETRGYALSPLSTSHDVLFPQPAPARVTREGYAQLWQSFTRDLVLLERSGPIVDDLRLAALLAVLRKYLWCVPAATPGYADEDDAVVADVSLYDHLKTTAALAACLQVALSDDDLDGLLRAGQHWDRPLARLVRGDFSGIQSFIYRIARPEAEGEFEHIAKRLRGRSFYLSLLCEVAADFFMRTLGLSAINVLFVGGGRFDLLVPAGAATQAALDAAQARLDDWLLETFTGELGLQIVAADLHAADAVDMRRVYAELDTRLAAGKQRKWERRVLEEDFHVSPRDEYHACPVCHTLAIKEPGSPCDQCRQHADLGRRLPHAAYLALAYGDAPLPAGAWLTDFQQALGVRVAVLSKDEANELFAALGRAGAARPALMLHQLNATDFLRTDAPSGTGLSFRFLANAAPVALRELRVPGAPPDETVGPHEVLHFEAIAHLSTGAKRLGVLKADVDHLGLLFGEGLLGEHDRPTIARFAALSGATDVFFSGWLNELCADVARKWTIDQAALPRSDQHPWANQVTGLFYVMYAGGDDLLIIGPWDATLALAERLQSDWSDYACRNPNVKLSAGLILAKPRYPVQRFAAEADEALHDAKGPRNSIGVFSRVVPWTPEGGPRKPSYAELLLLGRDMRAEVEAGQMPRTLVHDLGRLERQHRETRTGRPPLRPMWTPRLYYTLARRLNKDVRQRLGPRLIAAMSDILVSVSYVSYVTRKE